LDNPGMKQRSGHPVHRNNSAGVRLIEQTISSSGAPVIGLYLFMVSMWLARSMARGSRFAAIRPGAIGIPALLKARPGLSQAELADLMGIERMTAGLHVLSCIRSGLVRRERSPQDRRKYRLYVTRKGERNLLRMAALIPSHEQHFFGQLSRSERNGLYRSLRKLIEGSVRGADHQ
jgi:DNA-binding MarR family transcriptional regulator